MKKSEVQHKEGGRVSRQSWEVGRVVATPIRFLKPNVAILIYIIIFAWWSCHLHDMLELSFRFYKRKKMVKFRCSYLSWQNPEFSPIFRVNRNFQHNKIIIHWNQNQVDWRFGCENSGGCTPKIPYRRGLIIYKIGVAMVSKLFSADFIITFWLCWQLVFHTPYVWWTETNLIEASYRCTTVYPNGATYVAIRGHAIFTMLTLFVDTLDINWLPDHIASTNRSLMKQASLLTRWDVRDLRMIASQSWLLSSVRYIPITHSVSQQNMPQWNVLKVNVHCVLSEIFKHRDTELYSNSKELSMKVETICDSN